MEHELASKDAALTVQDMSDHNLPTTSSSSYSRKRHYEAATEDEDISKGYNSPQDPDLAPGHDSKRSRTSKWPHYRSPEADDRPSKGRHSRRSTMSPRQKRGSNSAPRPSKFLEGSMNDRVSNKPPSPYLGEQNALEQYAAVQPASTRMSVDTDTFYDAGIESNKPSGMYRFGKAAKALASAFNPSAWRGINSLFKEKEKHTLDPGKALMDERQEKARKAYDELKKTGFKGTQGSARLSMTGDVPAFKYENTSSQDSRPMSLNDSAIDIDDYRSSVDHKESHQSAQEEEVMPAPNIPYVDKSISPMPNASGRRSSLNLRTPSFQTLKKATSHIQLPSVKRHSTEVSDGSQQVKKQPSKKDLAKQQKLVKRVSNLELQLETARQELEQSLASTPAAKPVGKTTRKPFKPGALPSLPSERLLNAHVNEQGVDEENIGVVTRSASQRVTPKPTPTSQLQHELQDSAPAVTPSSRKRKARTSVEGNSTQRKHSEVEYDSVGWQSATAPAPPKHANSVRKPVPLPIAPTPTRPLLRTSSFANTGPGPELRRPSHLRTRPDIPAVPALPPTVSPSEVDKVAVLGMRSTPNISIPFGGHPDDVLNLRKTYPLLSADQVETLIGKFRPDGKVTDYTSTAHHGQPPSPALAPPSPVKAQQGFKPSISKSSLRSSMTELKGPNNSPADVAGTFSSKSRGRKTRSAQNIKSQKGKSKAEDEDGEGGDVVADLSPSKNEGKQLPPYPKGDGSQNVEKKDGKPLPAVRKESYDWDEDVF